VSVPGRAEGSYHGFKEVSACKRELDETVLTELQVVPEEVKNVTCWAANQ
jgi:hypothetical protein